MQHLRLGRSFVFVILLIGWALRLYGLNWDQGHGLHPDERHIAWVASSIYLPEKPEEIFHPHRTGLNPYAWPPAQAGHEQPEERTRPFSYGHWPLYLMVLASGGDADQARLTLVGRVLSALSDTATIVLTFALGRLLYGVATGTLAALFLALTVTHVQLAHFATFDTALTCWVVATLLFAARFARRGRWRDAAMAGLGLGLAVGAKFSAIFLLLPLALAHLFRWEQSPQPLAPRVRRLALSLLLAFLVFGLTNPFALIQADQFVANLRDQGAMLRGDDNFAFTYQYHDTLPFLYPVEQQLRWGMGLPLGLVAFGGLAYALARAWRRAARAEEWVPLAWAVIYFGFAGSLQVKFMRYMLPLLPVLAIYGARMLQAQGWRTPRGPTRLYAALVLLPTLLYALAFLNVYRGDHPWVKLSRWMYDHLPPGVTILHERWDHPLPLTLDEIGEPGRAGTIRWPGEFHLQAIDPYAPDTPEKLAGILEQLSAGDYLVIASNRLYGSLARWPERYPLMRRYYQLLFDGQLGYRLISPLQTRTRFQIQIERHPQLGRLTLITDPFSATGLPSPLPPERQRPTPLTIALGRADESFTVYDHPRPLLFENEARLSAAEMAPLFADFTNGNRW